MPSITPAMMRQEATRVTIRKAAPMRQASVEVSPMEPWMVPRKASVQVMPAFAMAVRPPSLARYSAVAPL